MQEPAEDKSDNQQEKYQQRARHGDAPEKKADFHNGNILGNEYHNETCKDDNQYQFEVHLPTLHKLYFVL